MNKEKSLLYAYMAGIIDGEGSISIVSSAKHKPYIPKITVSNTNYEMIDLFEKEFGGKVRRRSWSSNQKNINENWKDAYEWTLIHQKAAKVIECLYPFLRIKKTQAILLLRLARLKHKYNGAQRRWDKELDIKCMRVYEKIKLRCKKLNQRGRQQSL